MQPDLLARFAEPLGLAPDEARPILARLVASIQRTAEERGGVFVPGLGTFRRDGGTLSFEPAPDLASAVNHRYAGLAPLVPRSADADAALPTLELDAPLRLNLPAEPPLRDLGDGSDLARVDAPVEDVRLPDEDRPDEDAPAPAPPADPFTLSLDNAPDDLPPADEDTDDLLADVWNTPEPATPNPLQASPLEASPLDLGAPPPPPEDADFALIDPDAARPGPEAAPAPNGSDAEPPPSETDASVEPHDRAATGDADDPLRPSATDFFGRARDEDDVWEPAPTPTDASPSEGDEDAATSLDESTDPLSALDADDADDLGESEGMTEAEAPVAAVDTDPWASFLAESSADVWLEEVPDGAQDDGAQDDGAQDDGAQDDEAQDDAGYDGGPVDLDTAETSAEMDDAGATDAPRAEAPVEGIDDEHPLAQTDATTGEPLGEPTAATEEPEDTEARLGSDLAWAGAATLGVAGLDALDAEADLEADATDTPPLDPDASTEDAGGDDLDAFDDTVYLVEEHEAAALEASDLDAPDAELDADEPAEAASASAAYAGEFDDDGTDTYAEADAFDDDAATYDTASTYDEAEAYAEADAHDEVDAYAEAGAYAEADAEDETDAYDEVEAYDEHVDAYGDAFDDDAFDDDEFDAGAFDTDPAADTDPTEADLRRAGTLPLADLVDADALRAGEPEGTSFEDDASFESEAFAPDEATEPLDAIVPGADAEEGADTETPSASADALEDDLADAELAEVDPVDDEPIDDEWAEDAWAEEDLVESDEIDLVEVELVEAEALDDDAFAEEPVEVEAYDDASAEDAWAEPIEGEPVEAELGEAEPLAEEPEFVEAEPIEDEWDEDEWGEDEPPEDDAPATAGAVPSGDGASGLPFATGLPKADPETMPLTADLFEESEPAAPAPTKPTAAAPAAVREERRRPWPWFLVPLLLLAVVVAGYLLWSRLPGADAPVTATTQAPADAAPADAPDAATAEPDAEAAGSETLEASASSGLYGSGGIDLEAGGYTWVVTAGRDAEAQVARYRAEGYRSDVVRGETDAGVVARVCLGQFATLEAARAVREQLPEGVPVSSWILPLDSPTIVR